jgi:foldase protein PrsA
MPLLLALVASLAACGGGSQNVPANAIAVVGGTPITTAEFNTFFEQALENAANSTGGVKPPVGSAQYTAIRNQAIAELVEIQELKQQAPKEGVSVSPSDVDKYIANLIKTNYGGSQKKFNDALKSAKLTLDEAKQQVLVSLLAKGIHDKVTASAKVTDSQELADYHKNIAQYVVQAATTREVAHILVKTKAQANKIEQKLRNGASFAALAKKYSTDTGSAANGGKLCIAKPVSAGVCIQTVAPFSNAGFKLKTGAISAPVHSQYGWHVITALGPVKNQKQHTAPFSQVKSTIEQQLLQQAQEALWSTWTAHLTDEYKGKVSYQNGYAPPATTALSTTVDTTTTPAG